MIGNNMHHVIKKARDFAILAHGEQLYGDEPYIVHLDAVAEIVKDFSIHIQVLAYLHDTIEDTNIVRRDIEKEFDDIVARSVEYLTDVPASNRKERKKLTNQKLATIKVGSSFEPVLVAKSADRLANMESCIAKSNSGLLKMYFREYPEFKNAVYRPNICEDIWVKLERIYYSKL